MNAACHLDVKYPHARHPSHPPDQNLHHQTQGRRAARLAARPRPAGLIAGGSFSSNAGYGIEAELAGTLNLNNARVCWNGLGDILLFAGTLVIVSPVPCEPPAPPIPTSLISVGSGGSATLEADPDWGVRATLFLRGGDSGTFAGPLSGTASVHKISDITSLPDVLPPGFNFVSALAGSLSVGGSPVTILPAGGRFIASFAIPAGMEGLDFTILYWDETTGAWVELPDVMVTPEGFVTVTTDFVGIFVLATK